MSVKNQNTDIWKGDTRSLAFFINDATDLEGYSAVWTMADEGKPVLLKQTRDGSITFDGNRVLVHLESQDTDYTSNITAGEYEHQLYVGDAQNHGVVASEGKIAINDALYKLGI